MSCILCNRLTREKCGNKISPFKCVHCKAVTQDVLSTSDLKETVELTYDDELVTIPVVMACHDDINQLPLYFCVLCGETFPTNEEFAIHTTDYEESQYPCASCDEYFRTSTDLTDHV